MTAINDGRSMIEERHTAATRLGPVSVYGTDAMGASQVYPSADIKRYAWPDRDQVVAQLRRLEEPALASRLLNLSESQAARFISEAAEMVCECFADRVEMRLASEIPDLPSGVRAVQVGRSGGHLILAGLPDVREWDEAENQAQMHAWVEQFMHIVLSEWNDTAFQMAFHIAHNLRWPDETEPKPTVVIHTSGGVVTQVEATLELAVEIIDHDDDPDGEERESAVAGLTKVY